jgi:transcriptional regulator with XRE-family HTH domain
MHVLPARDAMERIGDTIGGASDLTQVELAARLQVSQNRVSRSEHGDIDRVQVDTLRKYVDAVGGRLRVEVELGTNGSRSPDPTARSCARYASKTFECFQAPECGSSPTSGTVFPQVRGFWAWIGTGAWRPVARRTRPATMEHWNDKQPGTFWSFMVAREGRGMP